MRRSVLFLLLAFAPALASAVESDPVFEQPDAARLGYAHAKTLIKEKRFEEAIPILRNALLRWPNDADIHNDIGFALRKSGRIDEGYVHYMRALSLNPAHKQAHEYLGELYLERGQPDLAKALLAELTKLCPNGCEERTDLEEAIQAYENR